MTSVLATDHGPSAAPAPRVAAFLLPLLLLAYLTLGDSPLGGGPSSQATLPGIPLAHKAHKNTIHPRATNSGKRAWLALPLPLPGLQRLLQVNPS